MVIASVDRRQMLMRWSGFLTLSLFANLFFLSQMQLNSPALLVPDMSRIKISLMSISGATPPAALPKQEIVKPVKIVPAQAMRPVLQDVETKVKAERKIVTIPVIQKIKPPVLTPEVTVKPAPKPRLKPIKVRKVEPVKTVRPVTEVQVPKEQPVIEKVASDVKITKLKATVRPEVTPAKLSSNIGTSAATVIHKASYRKRSAPVYPRRAYELGQQGIVLLHAFIGEDGRTEKLKIKNSSGHRLLDKAAMSAVSKWEFEPKTLSGRKIASWVRVPVKFAIR
jgi:periplasmic protein TonB